MVFPRFCSKFLIKRFFYNPICNSKLYDHHFARDVIYKTEKSQKSPDTLDEHIDSKILFSSVLEGEKLNRGFSRNTIAKDFIKKENYKQKIEETKQKPFSAFLKQLNEDSNIEVEQKIESEQPSLQPAIKDVDFEVKDSNFPKFWLNEYEFFDEDEEEFKNSEYGTSNPDIPPSNVPCSGCGAHLHCADLGVPGYIPYEIFKNRSNKELRTIICQRCHFLKHYNIALDVVVKPEDYINTLSSIKTKFALAVLIVDLLDFPCSIWPQMNELLGEKRPVIVVGNKVDLLPNDSKGYLEYVKEVVTQSVRESGLDKLNIKKTCLISAKTGYGIEELITQLHNIWKYEGDVYLIGCANVGKSSLFNALLRSDYCKVEASDLVKKATTCPWPGTTLKMLKFPILRPSDIRIYERFRRLQSERYKQQAEAQLRRDQLRKSRNYKHAVLTGHIGMTFKNPSEKMDPFSSASGTEPILSLDENSKLYSKSKWCYDTPGVINPQQIHNLLTTEELILMNPNQMITPRAFRISIGMTLFLAGLARIDFLSGDLEYLKLYIFASAQLPIVITRTKDANFMYKKLLGTKYFGVPTGDNERLDKWPELEPTQIDVVGVFDEEASCDVLLSSAGWMSLKTPNSSISRFSIWSPQKRGIILRKPALIRYPDKLCGPKIRKSLSYKVGKPFVL